MTSRLAIVVGTAIAAVSVAGCASTRSAPRDSDNASDSDGALTLGKPMPDLRLSPLGDGEDFQLKSLRGKIVLLDIWASWCAPCKEEMPMLDAIATRLKSKGVEVIAVSIDEEREAAEAFLQSRKKWSLRLVHDPAGKVPEVLKPPKMPTSYVIDERGVLRYVNVGFSREDMVDLETRLRELAAEAAP